MKAGIPLFPSLRYVRVELKFTLALLTLSIRVGFFLIQLDLRTEAIRAFEVRKDFLYVTPLFT